MDRVPPPPSLRPSAGRTIAHVDADAFFASIEIRDRPELAGRPVIVGGSPQSRGVVSTCNYIARRYGVRSAMPAAEALRRCPDAVFLRPDFPRYAEASRRMRAIFESVSDRVEPLSLDEAFIDLTGLPGGANPVEVMRGVKARVRDEVGVTVSVGIAPNKFLAKLASDWEKPDGFTVWDEACAREVLRGLPVEKMWGVGPKTAERLRARGLATAGDLADAGAAALVRLLGSWGYELHALSLGIDHRPVCPDRVHKSSGREETFDRDIRGREACLAELARLSEDLAADLRESGTRGQTVTLKVRYADFRTVTRAVTLERPTNASGTIYRAAAALLAKVAYDRPIRLLGVSVSRLVGPGDFVQPSLFEPEGVARDARGQAGPEAGPAPDDEAVQAVLDTVRARYGRDALRRARALWRGRARERARPENDDGPPPHRAT